MNNSIYPTGIVKLYDTKTSKVLFEGHNMILDAGRQYIRELFLTNFLNGITEVWSEIEGNSFYNKRLKLYGIVLGNDSSATQLLGDYSSLLTNGKLFKAVKDSGTEISDNFELDLQSNYIKLTVNITTDSEFFTATELGIVVDDGSTKDIFSRVVFDPISFEAGSSVTLEYSIYF